MKERITRMYNYAEANEPGDREKLMIEKAISAETKSLRRQEEVELKTPVKPHTPIKGPKPRTPSAKGL